MIEELKERWEEIWRTFQAEPAPQAVFEDLVRAYSFAGRSYHNLTHLMDCLSVFDRTKSLAAHPDEVELAIWFHDALYDTRRGDNEQKSAEWAEQVIRQAGLGREVAQRAYEIILATRHTTEATGADAQLMVDVDLAILGAASERYWQYERDIREEYAWVPEDLFRQKRAEILLGFLSRPFIYHHKPYREEFEANARFNVQQAVAMLLNTGKG